MNMAKKAEIHSKTKHRNEAFENIFICLCIQYNQRLSVHAIWYNIAISIGVYLLIRNTRITYKKVSLWFDETGPKKTQPFYKCDYRMNRQQPCARHTFVCVSFLFQTQPDECTDSWIESAVCVWFQCSTGICVPLSLQNDFIPSYNWRASQKKNIWNNALAQVDRLPLNLNIFFMQLMLLLLNTNK